MKEKAEKEKKTGTKESRKKTTKGRKGRKNIEDLIEQRVTYSCGKMYVEDDEEQWIECDVFDTWYHVRCTDLPVLGTFDENMDYTCAICVDQGFPSYEAN